MNKPLDLAIIGSGPAALTAAIYTARAGLKTTVYERKQIGGALTEITRIANFPGFIGSGADLATQMQKQAIAAGAKIEYGEMTGLSERGPEKELLFLIDNEPISARSILIATGSEPRPLNIPTTTHISYCATCDAPLYKDKDVIVVGGGNSAVQESLHLVNIVRSLHLISHSKLCAQPMLIKALKSYSNVSITENTEPTTELLDSADGVFAFIGKRPATNFLPSEILNPQGYIVTDEHNMTAIPGIFAAGDVRNTTVKQAITAAGDGAAAAIAISDFLQSTK